MRKYQQLFIAGLGLLSFIFFLIYKHEYDRLRYVMENLNIFGNPPSVIPSPDLAPPGNKEGSVDKLQDLIPTIGS